MQKQNLLTKLLLLVTVMIMGAGAAWADETTISVGSSDLTWTADGNDYTATSGDFTLRYEKGNYNQSISGGIQSAELRLYSGTNFVISSSKTITKIVYTVADGSGKNYSVSALSTADGNLENGTWTGSATSVSASLSAQNRIKSVTITYTGGDSNLNETDFVLNDAPVNLSFDLNNNKDAQVISYTTSSTGEVTVRANEYVETEVDEDAKTITVTPKKKTNGAQEITVNQAADDNYKAGTVVFTVTIDDSTPKSGGWVKTNIADLTEDDVFVIVGDNGDTYAMSNDNGASNAPTAVEVTVEDDEITSDVAENIQWNISYNSVNDTYNFYPNGSTETWLYCTTSNNGVRVGTNENNSFRIANNYLFNVETSTYLGIYSSQDWRRYGSINSNISGQTFAFYKYVDNATVKTPVIDVAETFIGSTTATITCATEGATIYYSYNGEDWTEYTDALTITETTTIYAKAVMGEDESAVVSKTTTKTLPTPTVTIDATGITNTDVYTGVEAGSLTATVTYNDAAIEGTTVTWSGNNDEVATINEATGAVTLVAAGSVTFTATFAGNAEYNGATDTYVLTVTNTDPDVPGTVNNPYTVAQAIDVIKALPNNNVTTEKYYIKGIVSSFQQTNIVDDGSYYRYFISDDGTTTTQLQVFKGKGLNEAIFTNADDLLVGDEVVIYGPIQYYNDKVPEIAEGNYIVSLNRPVVTTPSITVNANSIEATADGAEGTITVTYNNITDVVAEVYFCDVDGNATTYDWVTAEINDENNVYYLIDANEGAARTAYMKVYALDDNGEDVYSELITITQAKYVAPDVTVNPAVAGVGAFVKVTSTADITAGNYLIVAEDFNAAFDGSRDADNMDKAENIITVTIIDGKIAATNATVAATFTIQPSGSLKSASGVFIGKAANSNGLDTDEEALPNTFAIDEDGNVVITAEGNCTLRYNKASDQQRFRYYKSGQQPIQLYKYDATAPAFAPVKVTAAGYATYCFEKDIDFTNVEDLTAYKATVSSDKKVSFEEVKQVPAGQGVLLKGVKDSENTYAVPVIESATAITDNAFIGVTEETADVPAGIFVLLNGDKGVGFYKTSSAGFTVGANTAYLPAEVAPARSFIGFDFDVVTAIDSIAAETMANGEVYNLQGQRVATAQKGLYIVNGKKVVIK